MEEKVVKNQGTSPIAKIAIAIPIVIWKKIGDLDRDRGMTIADLFGDLFTYWFGLMFSKFIIDIHKLI